MIFIWFELCFQPRWLEHLNIYIKCNVLEVMECTLNVYAMYINPCYVIFCPNIIFPVQGLNKKNIVLKKILTLREIEFLVAPHYVRMVLLMKRCTLITYSTCTVRHQPQCAAAAAAARTKSGDEYYSWPPQLVWWLLSVATDDR